MNRFAARLWVATIAVVLTLGVGFAYAGYPNTVKGAWSDCGAGHDPLVGHYSVSVLEQALATLPTSDVEYSTCKDSLENAIRAATTRHPTTGSGTTNPAGGGSTGTHGKPPTTSPSTSGSDPIKQRLSAAVSNGHRPQQLNGVVYTPGAITTHGSSFLSTIPTPVLAVLAALVATLGALGGVAVRNVVRTRRAH